MNDFQLTIKMSINCSSIIKVTIKMNGLKYIDGLVTIMNHK